MWALVGLTLGILVRSLPTLPTLWAGHARARRRDRDRQRAATGRRPPRPRGPRGPGDRVVLGRAGHRGRDRLRDSPAGGLGDRRRLALVAGGLGRARRPWPPRSGGADPVTCRPSRPGRPTAAAGGAGRPSPGPGAAPIRLALGDGLAQHRLHGPAVDVVLRPGVVAAGDHDRPAPVARRRRVVPVRLPGRRHRRRAGRAAGPAPAAPRRHRGAGEPADDRGLHRAHRGAARAGGVGAARRAQLGQLAGDRAVTVQPERRQPGARRPAVGDGAVGRLPAGRRGSGRGRLAARHDRVVVAGAGRGGGAVGGAGAWSSSPTTSRAGRRLRRRRAAASRSPGRATRRPGTARPAARPRG